MLKVFDRGYDRKLRFYCKVPADTVSEGDMLDTEHGHLRVTGVGRTYGDPPQCYAYVDVTPELVGAPADHLTPEQQAARKRTHKALIDLGERRRQANDEEARYAILDALRRDGWSSRRNTPGLPTALRRVYARMLADGVIVRSGMKYRRTPR